MKFENFDLSDAVKKSLEKAGYSTATPIQTKAIPLILDGKDIVGKAQTGSGKTGAYLIPLISKMGPGDRVLVLVPVRELAEQAKQEALKFSSANPISVATIYGGSSYENQIRSTRRANIVVATPGRLIDLLSSNSISEFNPTTLVIDEADRMLDMGFLEDIKQILASFENVKQKLLFSATFSKEIKRIIHDFLPEHEYLEVEQMSKTNSDITQKYCVVNARDKYAALRRFLDFYSDKKTLIFLRTKMEADDLETALAHDGYQTVVMHGDTQQRDRAKFLNFFRNGQAHIMVATDIAARGLDVRDIGLVVNYSFPRDTDTYVHRIGRTGRAGEKGISLALIEARDIRSILRLQKDIKAKIEFTTVPSHALVQESWKKELFRKFETLEPQEISNTLAGEILKSENSLLQVSKLVELFLLDKTLNGPDQIGFQTAPREETESDSRGGSRDQRRDGPRDNRSRGNFRGGHGGRSSSSPRRHSR